MNNSDHIITVYASTSIYDTNGFTTSDCNLYRYLQLGKLCSSTLYNNIRYNQFNLIKSAHLTDFESNFHIWLWRVILWINKTPWSFDNLGKPPSTVFKYIEKLILWHPSSTNNYKWVDFIFFALRTSSWGFIEKKAVKNVNIKLCKLNQSHITHPQE